VELDAPRSVRFGVRSRKYFFFVSEYCSRPQMALSTVPGGEARTMVSPQQWRALVIIQDKQYSPKQSGINCLVEGISILRLFNNIEIFIHQNYIYFLIKKYYHV
jgi:hypothetical protein